jgi:hypothetical protein
LLLSLARPLQSVFAGSSVVVTLETIFTYLHAPALAEANLT